MFVASSHRSPKLKTKRDLEVVALALRYNSTLNEKCSIKYYVMFSFTHPTTSLAILETDIEITPEHCRPHTYTQSNNETTIYVSLRFQ